MAPVTAPSTEVAVVQDGSVALLGAAEAVSRSGQWCYRADVTEPHHVLGLRSDPPCVVVIDPFDETGTINDSELACPHVRFLVLSSSTSVDDARLAVGRGARGFLGKHADVSTLLDAVRVIGVGGLYFDPRFDAALMRPESAADAGVGGAELLTPREREVLMMVARGFTHKQISSRLHLSKATVDTYVHRVRQKTGSANKAGLTRVAIQLDLLAGVS